MKDHTRVRFIGKITSNDYNSPLDILFAIAVAFSPFRWVLCMDHAQMTIEGATMFKSVLANEAEIRAYSQMCSDMLFDSLSGEELLMTVLVRAAPPSFLFSNVIVH